MKDKLITYSLIVFLLSTGVFVSKIEITKNGEKYGSNFTVDLKSSANSGKIHIDNNWSETKSAGICTGEGTESNPYILKNLIINAGGIGDALCIQNTTEHFKIQNCTAFNSGGDFEDAGIKLINVTNGLLVNNAAFNNSRGVSIYYSLNIIFTMNTISYNENGMKIIHTNDSILYLNTFTLNSVIQFASQWSWLDHYSKKKFSYTYNGRSFTNYLGNYWEGYSGLDQDGDGIGDTPHIVYSYVPNNPDLKDYYPLIEPMNTYSNIKIANVIPGFNLISLVGFIGIITILLVITSKKLVKKSKKVF